MNLELAYESILREKCSKDFSLYRKAISGLQDKPLIASWLHNELSEHLHQFYYDYLDHKRPILIIQIPPQHGKSRIIVEFASWFLGNMPDKKIIYGSFSETLGIRANKTVQRIITSNVYKSIFPETKINSRNVVTDLQPARNAHLLEIVNHHGSFRNTTVNGSVTGESLDLGLIDDLIKGRKEASSETVRNSAWHWFTDDFYSRFADDAGLLLIGTSWHIDDPICRLRKKMAGKFKYVKYPAIAEQDEKHRKKGEALFPEHKSLEFINLRKANMLDFNFEAVYQQNPQIAGGDLFKRDWIKYYSMLPPESEWRQIIQSWDCAHKDKMRNDPSCCTTWLETYDGRHYLIDVFIERLKTPYLKRQLEIQYNKFKPFVILIEDKDSGATLIQDYAGKYMITGIAPKGTKQQRAEDCSEYHKNGFVYHPEPNAENSAWLSRYENELFAFPASTHDDQVDSTSQYFNWVKSNQFVYNFG